MFKLKINIKWYCNKSKRKKTHMYQGIFKIKSPETWKVAEKLVALVDIIQVPNGTEPGVRKSKLPLSVCNIRCYVQLKPLGIYIVFIRLNSTKQRYKCHE